MFNWLISSPAKVAVQGLSAAPGRAAALSNKPQSMLVFIAQALTALL